MAQEIPCCYNNVVIREESGSQRLRYSLYADDLKVYEKQEEISHGRHLKGGTH